MNSPGAYMKSPKSPRQLPQLPIAGQRSPVSSIKSPNSSSRVFEFPSSCSDGPKCSKFDFDDFASSQELSRSKSPSCSGISGMKSPRSNISISPGQESPVFQFLHLVEGLVIVKHLIYLMSAMRMLVH